MSIKVRWIVYYFGFSREIEPMGWSDRYTDNKELAQAIKEAEKSHALLSASSRPRKAAGVVIIRVQRARELMV